MNKYQEWLKTLQPGDTVRVCEPVIDDVSNLPKVMNAVVDKVAINNVQVIVKNPGNRWGRSENFNRASGNCGFYQYLMPSDQDVIFDPSRGRLLRSEFAS